eukprot:364416-Chlamydomonas_euryale.AAC.26
MHCAPLRAFLLVLPVSGTIIAACIAARALPVTLAAAAPAVAVAAVRVACFAAVCPLLQLSNMLLEQGLGLFRRELQGQEGCSGSTSMPTTHSMPLTCTEARQQAHKRSDCRRDSSDPLAGPAPSCPCLQQPFWNPICPRSMRCAGTHRLDVVLIPIVGQELLPRGAGAQAAQVPQRRHKARTRALHAPRLVCLMCTCPPQQLVKKALSHSGVQLLQPGHVAARVSAAAVFRRRLAFLRCGGCVGVGCSRGHSRAPVLVHAAGYHRHVLAQVAQQHLGVLVLLQRRQQAKDDDMCTWPI